MKTALLTRWNQLVPRRREIAVALFVPVLLLGAALSGEGILRWKQYRETGTVQIVEFNPETKPPESDISNQESHADRATRAEASRSLTPDADEASIGQLANRDIASGKLWIHEKNRRYPRPNARLGLIKMNSHGVRGQELAQPKPADIIRIGFYGASTTLGLEVAKDAETWPAIAMSHLGKRYPGCRFEFYNAGVIGYNLDAIARRLEQETRPLLPDVAVFLLSDVNAKVLKQLRERGHDLTPFQPSRFARTSILWQKLEKNAEALRLQRLATRPGVAARIDFDALEVDLRAALDEFAARVSDTGVPQVWVENAARMRREHSTQELVTIASSRLLYVPGVYIRDVVDSMYLYNDALEATARARGIPYYKTLSSVPADGQNYTDASHFTARGNQYFGDATGKALAQDRLIQKLATERACGNAR